MDRAYSLLEIKSADEDKREIRGMATTPTPDRVGDIIEPLGAKFTNPSPLLWMHQHDQPVGTVEFGKPTKAGIPFTAKIAKVLEAGRLQEMVDYAWQTVKAGLVRAVSIGFAPGERAYLEGGGIRFLSCEILELSLVTVPANAEATITQVKSIDRKALAATGHAMPVVRITPPGASGTTTGKSAPIIPKPLEGKNMNVQEQITQFTNARAAKSAAMESLLAKAAERNETLDAAQSEEYDGLAGEVASIDKHLDRLRTLQKAQGAAATATPMQHTPAAAAGASGLPVQGGASAVVAVEKKLAPGIGFARIAGIIAASKGSQADAMMMARERFPDDKHVQDIIGNMSRIKAAVDVGTTLDSDYAAPLVQYQQLANEFIEFLRPQTILGRIPGLRNVPFKIRVPRQLTGGSAGWVGEAKPKPVTSITFDNVTLDHTKLATIAVISDELARFSTPSAERLIRDALAGAIVQQMDSDFINPANAGTANVKPASVTNGVTAIPSSGNTFDNIIEDVQGVFAPWIAANLNPQTAVWVMSATTALALSLMVTDDGTPRFPGLTMMGGTFRGLPAIVSESVGNIVALVNASDIMVADDGEVTIDTSREASLQMDSAPTDPVTSSTVLVSLWQHNLLGIRAERFVNWVKARPQAVQYISGVAWGQRTSP